MTGYIFKVLWDTERLTQFTGYKRINVKTISLKISFPLNSASLWTNYTSLDKIMAFIWKGIEIEKFTLFPYFLSLQPGSQPASLLVFIFLLCPFKSQKFDQCACHPTRALY